MILARGVDEKVFSPPHQRDITDLVFRYRSFEQGAPTHVEVEGNATRYISLVKTIGINQKSRCQAVIASFLIRCNRCRDRDDRH